MNSRLIYRILVLDPTSKSPYADVTSLVHQLRGCSNLWKEPRVDERSQTIYDGETRLELSEVRPPSREGELGSAPAIGRAFLITLSGAFQDIERMREPLAGYLRGQQFEPIYVLKDEVSETIACHLYPHLYRVENLLRGYLIKFMSTRIGPIWWKLTASANMSDKVNMRRKNERVFGTHVEPSAYLIDFGDLGELIYKQSSGFLTQDDILKRINSLPETPDAIRELKEELRSNYQKFFKESFAEKDFKAKWQEFEALRNKIAHGNLFTADDLNRGQTLALEITEIINQAEAQTDHLVITAREKEAIQDTVYEESSSWKEISEPELIEFLLQQENYFHPNGGYVGLSHFVKTVLGYLGYDPRASYLLVDQLKQQNKIDVYHIDSGVDQQKVAAIRTIREAV